MEKYEPSKMMQYIKSVFLKIEKGLSMEEALERSRVPKICRPAVGFLVENYSLNELQGVKNNKNFRRF